MVQNYWADFDGWCASRNVEPLTLSVDRFCNLAQHWWTRNMSGEDREKFLANLSAPPGGSPEQQVRSSGVWSREAELAEFQR